MFHLMNYDQGVENWAYKTLKMESVEDWLTKVSKRCSVKTESRRRRRLMKSSETHTGH